MGSGARRGLQGHRAPPARRYATPGVGALGARRSHRPARQSPILVPLRRRRCAHAAGAHPHCAGLSGAARRGCASRSPPASTTSRATSTPTATLPPTSPTWSFHVGDYIYESSWGRDHVRKHNIPEPMTLEDYRMRYAHYKSDPDLQARARRLPVARHLGRPRRRERLRRRPLREQRSARMVPRAPRRRLQGLVRAHAGARARWCRTARMRASTRASSFGNLANFFVLDDRQFRSHQVCPRPGRGGSNTVDVAECARPRRPEAHHARRGAGAVAGGAARGVARALERHRAADADGAVRPEARARAAAPGPTAGTAIRWLESGYSILCLQEK